MTGDDIRELRRRMGLTHGELGALVFCNEQSVVRWEADFTRPRKAVAKRLQELLEKARRKDAAKEATVEQSA